tara:strand:+ start:4564 stop:6606 length:2043 start_codon:yes stop_codon:yes gene_type:complete
MHYFEFAEKDATLYEASQSLNSGLDEILEVRKDISDTATTIDVSRALIKFDLTEISESINAGIIPDSGSKAARYFLNLFDAKPTNLASSQSLFAYPVSQSWVMGDGRSYDNPITTDGCSWTFSKGQDDGTLWTPELSASGATWYQNTPSGSLKFTSGSAGNSFGTGSNDEFRLTVLGTEFNFKATSSIANGTGSIPDDSSPNFFFSTGSTTAEFGSNLADEINTADIGITASMSSVSSSLGGVGTVRLHLTASSITTLGLTDITAVTGSTIGFTTEITGTGTFASGTFSITPGHYENQELTIGGVDFVFVSGSSTSVFDNSATEIFILSGSTTGSSLQNLRDAINNSGSLHGLPISASVSQSVSSSVSAGITFTFTNDVLILSGSNSGSDSNQTAASSSVLFSFAGNGSISGGDVTKALEGGTAANVSTTTQFGSTGFSNVVFENGNNELGGGGVPYEASQSFTQKSEDVRMDVTNIVQAWLSQSIDNEGFLIKRTGNVGNSDKFSDENNTQDLGNFSFFSSDTHTKYPPTLEVVWDDSKWRPGTLEQLSSTELEDTVIYMKGLRPEYKEKSKARFRVVGRARYPETTFSTTPANLTVKVLPPSSSFYSILDAETDDVIVPFGSGSKLSCDSNGNFFNLDLNGFQPERYYKIEYRIQSGSKTDEELDLYYDEGFTFKVSL